MPSVSGAHSSSSRERSWVQQRWAESGSPFCPQSSWGCSRRHHGARSARSRAHRPPQEHTAFPPSLPWGQKVALDRPWPGFKHTF